MPDHDTAQPTRNSEAPPVHEHFDVLIVGAGLSGIGAASSLQRREPGRRYAILESREAIGGTWDLFRYPGVRSDSDMQTLGYRHRLWTRPESIGDGASIRDYVRETAREEGIERHIRFGHKVVRTEWSSDEAQWAVEAEHEGRTVTVTCRMLLMCSGYYRYDQGYRPDFPGMADFAGQLVHPQFWPEDLDYAGKRVVVIGSGATAITLVPAMATTAAGVTMLQRTPTYVVNVPSRNPLDAKLRSLLGEQRGTAVARWKNITVAMGTYWAAQRFPSTIRSALLKETGKRLPEGFDLAHFSPEYGPWDQRLCASPESDLFQAISDGRADVVTDGIDTFTAAGIRLISGRELEADIIVTATGLEMLFFGGAALTVDGRRVSLPDTTVYKGVMLSGVPNMVFTFGYINSSWTLKADLVNDFVCRLLRHMDKFGYRSCVPTLPSAERERGDLFPMSSGYIQRALDRIPGSGTGYPWRLGMNWFRDFATLRHGRLDDGHLVFLAAPAAAGTEPRPTVAWA